MGKQGYQPAYPSLPQRPAGSGTTTGGEFQKGGGYTSLICLVYIMYIYIYISYMYMHTIHTIYVILCIIYRDRERGRPFYFGESRDFIYSRMAATKSWPPHGRQATTLALPFNYQNSLALG